MKPSLKKARALRALSGYDPNPPLCGNCRRFFRGIKDAPPFCGVNGQNVSATAVCDYWIGTQGDTLAPEPTAAGIGKAIDGGGKE